MKIIKIVALFLLTFTISFAGVKSFDGIKNMKIDIFFEIGIQRPHESHWKP